MAEFGEVVEGVEEAIEGAEEGIEDLPAEERAEVEAEIAESRASVEELSATRTKFQKILEFAKSGTVWVIKFTSQNIMIGVILWGVNTALNKWFPHGSQESNETQKRIRNVIKALCDVISTEGTINKKALDWMTVHEGDNIILDGVEVPMESVLIKYIKPLVQATDQAETIANALQEKVDGKVQFKCPTADDMRKFMDITEVYIKAFSDLIKYILKIEDKVTELHSFPVNNDDLIDLSAKLSIAKALPLW